MYLAEDIATNARVLRVPIAGGTMETLASGFKYASAIAVDSTSVYVGEGSSGNIYQFPLTGSDDGGVPQALTHGSQDVGGVMAITSTNLYWGTGDYGGAIFSYQLGSGAAQGTPFGGNQDMGISIDSTDMFWGNQYSGSISTRSILPDAGPQFDLVPQGVETTPTEVRPQNGVIYWGATYKGGAGIFSFPIAPQVPPVSPTLLAQDSNTPWHVFVDSKYIYWLSNGASPPGIQYIPLTGGPTQILVPAVDETVYSMTQDANYIYYTHGVDNSDSTLVRVAKPN